MEAVVEPREPPAEPVSTAASSKPPRPKLTAEEKQQRADEAKAKRKALKPAASQDATIARSACVGSDGNLRAWAFGDEFWRTRRIVPKQRAPTSEYLVAINAVVLTPELADQAGELVTDDGERRKLRDACDDRSHHARVLKHLHERGYHTTCGLKYGADYLCYDQHPDFCHAFCIVHVRDRAVSAMRRPERSCAARLAQSTKKCAVFAWPTADGVEALVLTNKAVLEPYAFSDLLAPGARRAPTSEICGEPGELEGELRLSPALPNNFG